ncbi:hypothetical protein L580_1802 [Serratia fonticola AU-P3(3)]|nr:hypothetical protein L580_1802 [Serratia fonticola AU-P3(3)]
MLARRGMAILLSFGGWIFIQPFLWYKLYQYCVAVRHVQGSIQEG